MAKDNFNFSIPKTWVFLLIGIFIGGVGVSLLDIGSGSAAPSLQPSQPETENPNQRFDVSTDDDPVLGNDNAPVTVIEFSDFECPFCQRAYADAIAGIKRDYVNNGQVKIVYRDFPLSFHPQAAPAAEAAECADDQGKFWEFHDALFENQDRLSDSYYRQLAGELGLDTTQFNSCLDSRTHQSEVENDQTDGSAAGVSGTPTFFIGNDKDGYIRIVGAQPYSTIKQVIESELE